MLDCHLLFPSNFRLESSPANPSKNQLKLQACLAFEGTSSIIYSTINDVIFTLKPIAFHQNEMEQYSTGYISK